MNSSIHFSNYSLIFGSWHYHFRYLISKKLAPVNVKQSKLLLCLDPSNTSDTICCKSICILIWSYLILMDILYPVVYCLVWSISQVPGLGYIYVCTVRKYWSNSLYQGRYTWKSLWLRLASVDQCSPQYNYKNYLWGDVCGSLYVYFNVKCLHSVYCFLVTILFMNFKPIKYFWFHRKRTPAVKLGVINCTVHFKI